MGFVTRPIALDLDFAGEIISQFYGPYCDFRKQGQHHANPHGDGEDKNKIVHGVNKQCEDWLKYHPRKYTPLPDDQDTFEENVKSNLPMTGDVPFGGLDDQCTTRNSYFS